ncbi:uncharacterized protein LOC115890987 [Sitophilus oryzae]|uniref:Uncharacterized protein LOC115890987 n=1 Tax=Sitophilus oryzae TaxID=7048 RepID=A0A6J2YVL4_SITOR|nr:uncharacterized protein LOC115890987 [Sitophilus oryzae]
MAPNMSMNSTSSERNISNTTQETRQRKSKIDPLLQNITRAFNESRNTRQETSSEEEESSEEDANMLTGLLSSFLGGLSRPDGTIDLEAILGLLGSLSTQNPDGTYDFSGLTELLRTFFGGTDGGSDVGAFAGALIGAVIKGIANPPGAKGAGILSGKLASAILPALSGPPDTDDNAMKPAKPPQLDSGSFLTGFIKTFLGSGGNGTTQGGGKQSKYTLFKLIFSAITGVFQAASSLASKSDWQ